MKRTFLDTPPPSDFIGLPLGKYWIHTFPTDMSSGVRVDVTLNDVKKKIINFSGEKITPDNAPKQRVKLDRYTEISLRFLQKIKPMTLFLHMSSQIAFVLGKRESPIIIGPEILKPAESQIITYYRKKRKRKVINAFFLGPGHPLTDIHLAMAKCEVVVAVDTNTKFVPGIGNVAATTAIEAYFSEITNDASHIRTGPTRQKITINPPVNPELFGIGAMMFNFFEANPQLQGKRVGIITDTDLDRIKSICNRTEPIFNNMMLPSNTDLFYATADTGSAEFIPNKLIRLCDKASTKYLQDYLNTISHN